KMMVGVPTQSSGPENGAEQFHFSPFGSFKLDVEGSMALQAQKISEHEGRIQGLNTAVEAVRNSLNFWQTAALGLSGLILAALAIVVTYQLSMSDDIKEQGQRFTTLDQKVDALPGKISDSIRATSRD